MSRLIILAVVGLLLGLGGSTGAVVMRAKKTVVAVARDSSDTADSTSHAAEPDKADVPPELVTPPRQERAAQPAPAPTPTTAKAAEVARPQTAGSAPDTSRASAPQPGRIAKIFAAMSPRDAARVLEQLDDADVQVVLSGLTDKQAAAILAGFPPPRAAAISRAAIRGRKAGGSE